MEIRIQGFNQFRTKLIESLDSNLHIKIKKAAQSRKTVTEKSQAPD